MLFLSGHMLLAMVIATVKGKDKGNVHPRTGHEGP